MPPVARDTIPGPPSDKLDWPSMPTFKPSKLKHRVYVTYENKFVRLDLRSHAILSGLDRLKVPYGHLPRRREVWGAVVRRLGPDATRFEVEFPRGSFTRWWCLLL